MRPRLPSAPQRLGRPALPIRRRRTGDSEPGRQTPGSAGVLGPVRVAVSGLSRLLRSRSAWPGGRDSDRGLSGSTLPDRRRPGPGRPGILASLRVTQAAVRPPAGGAVLSSVPLAWGFPLHVACGKFTCGRARPSDSTRIPPRWPGLHPGHGRQAGQYRDAQSPVAKKGRRAAAVGFRLFTSRPRPLRPRAHTAPAPASSQTGAFQVQTSGQKGTQSHGAPAIPLKRP